METYISICKIDSQWVFAIWLMELKPWLCNNLERWDGGRWEGASRERGCIYTYGWFMLMFGRNQHNSVKQLSFNWIIKKERKRALQLLELTCRHQVGTQGHFLALGVVSGCVWHWTMTFSSSHNDPIFSWLLYPEGGQEDPPVAF